MKRNYITLSLVLVVIAINAYGQTKVTSLSGSYISGQNIRKLTKISFAPTMLDSSYQDFRQYFLCNFDGNENTYDCWISQWAFNSYKAQTIVDVSVTWNGETKDYTFKEFKKYIWP